MDTASARQVARALHTSVPRVMRAVDGLGLEVQRAGSGRLMLTERDQGALREHLGHAPPTPGLSRTEVRVLRALSRAPLGLASVRAAARRSRVSPTAAGRALRRLVERGLVLDERRVVAAGRVREARVFRANVRAEAWPELSRHLAQGEAPGPVATPPSERVPPRLRHLFWNVAPEQLSATAHGGFVARRLVQTGDLEGLAWGAAHMSAEDWDHAARSRGLEGSRRALAENLAAAAR